MLLLGIIGMIIYVSYVFKDMMIKLLVIFIVVMNIFVFVLVGLVIFLVLYSFGYEL